MTSRRSRTTCFGADGQGPVRWEPSVLDVLYVLGIIAYFGLVVESLRLFERLVRHREDNLADTAELEVSPDHHASG
jgi:hypothetical protein